MALIKCPECGKEISDKATVCINCGYSLESLKDVRKKIKSEDNIESQNYEYKRNKNQSIN